MVRQTYPGLTKKEFDRFLELLLKFGHVSSKNQGRTYICSLQPSDAKQMLANMENLSSSLNNKSDGNKNNQDVQSEFIYPVVEDESLVLEKIENQKRTRTTKKPKKVGYSLLMSEQMLEELRELSEFDGASVSHHIRTAVAEYLRRRQ